VLRIKKFMGPPRFRFCLFLIEIRRNKKTIKPINGIEYCASWLFCQIKTKANEPKRSKE
jgi:hypothetical protein